MNDVRIFCGTDDILDFLTRKDSVAAIRADAKEDGDESEEVGKSVWDEETTGVVSVAVYRVPSGDVGGSIVPGGQLAVSFMYF